MLLVYAEDLGLFFEEGLQELRLAEEVSDGKDPE
jgi:hypothetical protein